jgi:dihydroorotate dehydrogenase
MEHMIVHLEEIENIIAVEIGLPADIRPSEASEIVRASAGELPVIVRVPLTRAEELGSSISQAGAVAISLGPPRGALSDSQGHLVYGRHYGPAVFPQALRAVGELVKMEIPVIGGGGVYTTEGIDTILVLGAIAVQLDTILWRADWFPPTQEKDTSKEV